MRRVLAITAPASEKRGQEKTGRSRIKVRVGIREISGQWSYCCPVASASPAGTFHQWRLLGSIHVIAARNNFNDLAPGSATARATNAHPSTS